MHPCRDSDDFEADNKSILNFSLDESEFVEGKDYFIEDLFVYGRWKPPESVVWFLLFILWLPFSIPVFLIRAFILLGSVLFLFLAPTFIKDNARPFVHWFVFPVMGWICTSAERCVSWQK